MLLLKLSKIPNFDPLAYAEDLASEIHPSASIGEVLRIKSGEVHGVSVFRCLGVLRCMPRVGMTREAFIKICMVSARTDPG